MLITLPLMEESSLALKDSIENLENLYAPLVCLASLVMLLQELALLLLLQFKQEAMLLLNILLLDRTTTLFALQGTCANLVGITIGFVLLVGIHLTEIANPALSIMDAFKVEKR